MSSQVIITVLLASLAGNAWLWTNNDKLRSDLATAKTTVQVKEDEAKDLQQTIDNQNIAVQQLHKAASELAQRSTKSALHELQIGKDKQVEIENVSPGYKGLNQWLNKSL